MPIILKVPSVFSCKLPNGEWINLAEIRRLIVTDSPPAVTVEWSNGDSMTYHGDKATALAEAWSETETIDKSHARYWRRSGN